MGLSHEQHPVTQGYTNYTLKALWKKKREAFSWNVTQKGSADTYFFEEI